MDDATPEERDLDLEITYVKVGLPFGVVRALKKAAIDRRLTFSEVVLEAIQSRGVVFTDRSRPSKEKKK